MRKVLFIAGNISSFDATPIKIYDYIKASSHLLDKPVLLGLLDIRSFFDTKKKGETKKVFTRANISLVYVPRIFPLPLVIVLYYYLIKKYRKIYANNLTAGITGFLLKKFFNINYVFDFHGSIPEERVLIGIWNKRSLKYRLMKSMERKIAASSIGNVAISSAALQYLDCLQHPKPNLVIPCGINFDPSTISEDTRCTLRKRLDIEDKFVVLYSGSISPWNDYEVMKETIKWIKSGMNNFLFLVLSKDEDATISAFIHSVGVEENEILHLSVPHSEVHNYVSCADLALLIRKKSIVNKISSPMKFGEYVGAGVPVLISSEIGDASDEVEKYGLGMVLKDLSDLKSLSAFIADVKANRSAYFNQNKNFALKNYRLSSMLDKYQILFNA